METTHAVHMKDVTLRLPSCLFYQGLPELPRLAPELNTLAAEGITTGTDLNQTVSAIHTYRAQNVAVQNESNDFVVNGNFPEIAECSLQQSTRSLKHHACRPQR